MEGIPSNAVAAAPALPSASHSPSPHQAQKESKRKKKDPSTLVLACRQCRSRKVRCDSGRPQCKNCTRRCDPCEYDTTPKRRGPDKAPGRTRMYKKKPEGLERENRPARQTNAPSEPETLAERGVFGGRKNGNNSNTTSGQLTRTDDVPDLLSIVLEDVSSIATSQLSQTIPATAIGESFDDEDLKNTLRAGGFDSFDRFLSSEEYAFGGCFNQLSNNQITSVEQVPQSWSWNIPSSVYQAGRNYYAYERHSPTSGMDYIPRGPSVSFYKQTWWDSLLPLYSPDPSQSTVRIYQDLQFLYNNAIYWLSFMNLPQFMSNLFDAQRRMYMQPSVVLSALAFSTLMKSSETGLGAEGRKFAEWLRDAAQSSLEASLSASWIEPSLAHAAFFLVLFEASAHPNQTSARVSSAIFLLDSLIQGLSLTNIDAYELDSNRFPPNDIPSCSCTDQVFISPAPRTEPKDFPSVGDLGLESSICSCSTHINKNAHNNGAWLTSQGPISIVDGALESTYKGSAMHAGLIFKPNDPNPALINEPIFANFWKRPDFSVTWPDQTNFAEIQKEESRRLCWSAMVLISFLREYTPHLGHYAWDLYITRQENFALYFPGEAVERRGGKTSIWALHCRAALLWDACQKLRSQPDWNLRRVELTGKAWMEANDIERAITGHTCPLGRGVFFAGREYLFQLKLLVANNFTRLIPLPHTLNFERDSAQEWLEHRDIVATHMRKLVLLVDRFGANATSSALANRPLSSWWAIYQIRAGILVYKSDPTMHLALRQSLDFLAIVDFLTVMWPSPEQTHYYAQIRKELLDSCAEAGIEVPAPVPIRGLPANVNASMIPSPFFANKPSASDILMAPLD